MINPPIQKLFKPYLEPEQEALLGWLRYEKSRRLNPREWAELHARVLAGAHFDDMIDELPTPSGTSYETLQKKLERPQ